MKLLCEVMEVSRSYYYSYLRKRNQSVSAQELKLLTEVNALNKESRGSFGSRQMSKHLKQKGHAVGRYKARTLMRKAGISCKQRRRYKVTTDSQHAHPIAENHLNRQFQVRIPNRVWVTDISVPQQAA